MNNSSPKTLSLAASIVISMLAFAVLITIAGIIATVWPYNEFSSEPLDPNEDGFAKITSDTGRFTEEGYPIVNRSFSYNVHTCNNGVDLFVEKWLDSYGKYTPTSEIELGPEDRSGAVLIAVQEFYVPEAICADGVVEITIPGRVNPDIVYSLRVVYAYQGNPLNVVETVTRTEKFFLEKSGK